MAPSSSRLEALKIYLLCKLCPDSLVHFDLRILVSNKTFDSFCYECVHVAVVTGANSFMLLKLEVAADRTFLCGLIRSPGLSANLFFRNVPIKKTWFCSVCIASSPVDFWGWTPHVLIKEITLQYGNFKDFLLETYLFFSPLRDFKPLHYCCSPDMMQVWFCWTHKVANFPSSTVLPAAYVGVGSRFAIIAAGSCKGTHRAEKVQGLPATTC